MLGPPSELATQIAGGNRRALARGITLVESTRSDHRDEATALLTELMGRTGAAQRVGISGAPGSGKSPLIQALGLQLLDAGHRVAVLAIDPSSPRGGGSILGDKTRMDELSRRAGAFVRPSPTSGTLGGVARRTREAMLLCEAAGFDVVLIETVGVGQSEVTVEAMVDCLVLLIAPGGGDDLQGIKRGIMELADIVVVNKADGALAKIAEATARDYEHALHLLRPKTPAWHPVVVRTSALECDGIAELWSTVLGHHAALGDAALAQRRGDQARTWMWDELSEALLDRVRQDPAAGKLMRTLEPEVAAGLVPPPIAALRILDLFGNSDSSS